MVIAVRLCGRVTAGHRGAGDKLFHVDPHLLQWVLAVFAAIEPETVGPIWKAIDSAPCGLRVIPVLVAVSTPGSVETRGEGALPGQLDVLDTHCIRSSSCDGQLPHLRGCRFPQAESTRGALTHVVELAISGIGALRGEAADFEAVTAKVVLIAAFEHADADIDDDAGDAAGVGAGEEVRYGGYVGGELDYLGDGCACGTD